MALLLALYRKPADAAAFDAHYVSRHIPLAKKIPGLSAYEVNAGPVLTPQGESPYHLIAALSFESLAAIQQGFASPEGAAAAEDLQNFAQAGVDLLMFDTQAV